MTDVPRAQTPMALFDYELPSHLIAQTPLRNRSASRLLVLERASGRLLHRHFTDLTALLDPGDVVVVNDTRVLPARLIGRRPTGGRVELLLLRKAEKGVWRALIRPAKRLAPGDQIEIPAIDAKVAAVARAILIDKLEAGEALIRLDDALERNLADFGRIPLPPYITQQLMDDDRYQTVFSSHPGSAAAPTAGLHLTTDMLEQIQLRGVGVARVTLHVGLDTFRPVSEAYAEQHRIHEEWCAVPVETAEAIADAKRRGGRVIAVGTTVARTLETYARAGDLMRREAFGGMTGIFISPGYSWQVVDAMVTNFHLPRSTLLLMMSSFAGREAIMNAYREAIAEEYRFFSFGDAMLIL